MLGRLEIMLAAQALLVIYDALGLIPGLYLPCMAVSAMGVLPIYTALEWSFLSSLSTCFGAHLVAYPCVTWCSSKVALDGLLLDAFLNALPPVYSGRLQRKPTSPGK